MAETGTENVNNNVVTEVWACSTCTLINKADVIQCIACGTNKDGNTENSTAMWTCDICTSYNQVSQNVCINCGMPMGSSLQIDSSNSTSNSVTLGLPSEGSFGNMTSNEAISLLSTLMGIRPTSLPNMEDMTPAPITPISIF